MRSKFLITTIGLLLGTLASPLFAADDSKVIKTWKFPADAAAWTAQNDLTVKLGQNEMALTVTGGDPQLATKVTAPAGWKTLVVKAKFRGQIMGQIFWTTASQPATSEESSRSFNARGQNETSIEFKVFFKPESPVTGLRLDPTTNSKNPIRIESIVLLNEGPPEPKATDAASLKMPAGFKAELLYTVAGPEYGSWVSLCVDGKGRLITSDQDGKLYRLTVPAIGSNEKTKVETIPIDLGMAQGLCWAFDSLYVVVNGRDSGLYKVTDTNNDDVLDKVELLRKIDGGGEHGPHAVLLSPDGKSLYVLGGNHTKIPNPEKSLVPRNYQEDHLLPRMWDAGGHAVGIMAPGGWICRTDKDGKTWELFCSGFRNEYDIAFNADGELFTYDSDMEWDIGAPWYRPTRVNHAVAGAEFGWRSGSGKWPAYYPDSLPAVANVGPGSPTGVVFGTGAKFPAKYQKALFINDWSYGNLYAIHLTPEGASYTSEIERFCFGTPLPLTDIVIHPDGAMYFTIGGRKTQSGLYRITYVGNESTAPVDGRDEQNKDLRALRRSIEAKFSSTNPDVVAEVWPFLSHQDRHIRFAARIALEHQPVALWREKALKETNPDAAITAALALARSGEKSDLASIVKNLAKLSWDKLDSRQKLDWLRGFGLAFARFGPPSSEVRQLALNVIDPLYPAKEVLQNRELAQLEIYLEAPNVAERSMKLATLAGSQEESYDYIFRLRSLEKTWTPESRKAYFEWFNTVGVKYRGGHSFSRFIANTKTEALAKLTDAEKLALKPVLDAAPKNTDPADIPRAFVKKWTTDELLPLVDSGLIERNFVRGKSLFGATQCFKCHIFDNSGGIVGPNLTGVGRRFSNKDLVENIIDPSRVISDQYAATIFSLKDGRVITGRIANLGGETISVMTNMLDPGSLTGINANAIEETITSKASMMPNGLLDTLSIEEALDLIAYLKSGGNPNDPMFKKEKAE
ncbi:MAG: c-type cytochrome [Planctomycetota bacterium]|nr:c-type cytochrome [Planctomycetota bacterium]